MKYKTNDDVELNTKQSLQSQTHTKDFAASIIDDTAKKDKHDSKVFYINSFIGLLNLLLKEKLTISNQEDRKLHLKPLEILMTVICDIGADTSIADNLKITRIYIVIEGLTAYLKQFGLDIELQHKMISMRDNCLRELAFTVEYFYIVYRKELEKTLLFFALTDDIFSTSMLEALGIDFTKDKPWLVKYPHKFNLDNSKFLESTKLSLGLSVDASGCFIASMFSQGGFVLSKLDMYTEEFVKYAVTCNGTSFNIGSGYGIPERIALLLGAKKIICNDICAEHLDIIKALTLPSYHPRLSFICGSFPEEVNLPNNSIKVIGIFRVLHFLAPEVLVHAIRRIHNLLEPDGVLILTAETPHLGNWQLFIPEYERRVKNNEPWPGYISDTSIYETAGYSKNLPPKMHFLDVVTLIRVLTENGFTVERCTTFNRASTFPQNMLLDGRESVGAIARKIKTESCF